MIVQKSKKWYLVYADLILLVISRFPIYKSTGTPSVEYLPWSIKSCLEIDPGHFHDWNSQISPSNWPYMEFATVSPESKKSNNKYGQTDKLRICKRISSPN
jgi:hypothetical protein